MRYRRVRGAGGDYGAHCVTDARGHPAAEPDGDARAGEPAGGVAADRRASTGSERFAAGREWGVRGISGGAGWRCGRRGAAEAQALTAATNRAPGER